MNSTQTLPDAPAPMIAREGWPIVALFVVGGLVFSAAAALLGPLVAAGIGLVSLMLCVWCVWFFRDPQRAIPAEAGAVICPADGVVCAIGPAQPPTELAMAGTTPMTRVCVFMNVFNVHVNRAPMAGKVVKRHYAPGKFLNAAIDKASTENERLGLVIELPDGRQIASVQIAGLIARRIICRAREGQMLAAGERYGLIRFGSRVDVYLPTTCTVKVALGQKVSAGETVLASMQPAGSPSAQHTAAAAVGAGA